ncbi:hypothetical protein JYK22_05160, partial [Nonomuraea sp. RK-328]|nr:hypothetical protein [Nonomuraea sp. RK-328]
LDEPGRGLWGRITDAYELTTSELVTLGEACRTLDELTVMRAALAEDAATVTGSTGQPRAHPLYAEARAHRVLLSKLMADLALPVEGEDAGLTPAQRHARAAAHARWADPKWSTRGQTA